jgi:hypothetical protein
VSFVPEAIMTSQASSYLLLILFLIFAVQSAADEPADPEVVPVTGEPRHRRVLEDEHLRLFDVRIPSGDTTLYHIHKFDSIYIPISGFANLLNQEYEKAAKPLAIKPGAVAFAGHAQTPFTHRISNLSGETFHVIDIELISPPGDGLLGVLPAGRQPVLENPRVRISRIVLGPSEFVAADPLPSPHGVIVVLTGARIGLEDGSGSTQTSDIVPGQFFSRAEFMSQEIHNEGVTRLELISVEIK